MGDRVKLTITKMMYGWSKYGGGKSGLVKSQSKEWYCQMCGEKQVIELPSYMIPFKGDMREYIRICSKCKNKLVNL